MRFDKVTQRCNYNYVNISFWIVNKPDSDVAILGYDVTYQQDIQTLQQRFKISLATDKDDQQYSQIVLAADVDICKQLREKADRMNLETNKETISKELTCPFKKNLNLKSSNWTFTDALLPPMLNEQRFKVESHYFGTIEGKEGWQALYGIDVFGRFKRWADQTPV